MTPDRRNQATGRRERDARREIAARAADRWRALAVRALVGYAIVLSVSFGVVLGIGVPALNRAADALDHARRADAGVLRVERSSCHRLNIHRVIQDDRNDYRDWLFDRFFLGAILRPSQSTPETPRQKRQRLAAIVFLRNAVNSLTWTPATRGCSTTHPAHATPVRFVDRQPTPRDLRLRGDE